MKKSLVLTMAMALGISATAFAANPFSDVPQGHWAYGSISKLVAAGVVDGYPDGTFKGDNLMTRYEMAQIVAKAYAKGAITTDDKLIAEFADELDNLGVRVTKLEKKQDNVKITGQFRAGYKDWSGGANGYSTDLRTRLFVSGEINENWSYEAMIQNTQNPQSNAEESTTKFRRAFVKGNIGGATVSAGRQYFKVGSGYTADLTGDSVKVDFGNVLKATAFYGRFDSDNQSIPHTQTYDEVNDLDIYNFDYDAYGLALAYDISDALNLSGAYYKVDDNTTDYKLGIYTVGLGYNFDKNTNLYAEYLKADEKDFAGDDDGFAVSLKYKGANPAKKGSWGLSASYYDQATTTIIDHVSEIVDDWGIGDVEERNAGIKGYEIGVDYTLAKNIVAEVSYYDMEDSKNSGKLLWSRVTFSF